MNEIDRFNNLEENEASEVYNTALIEDCSSADKVNNNNNKIIVIYRLNKHYYSYKDREWHKKIHQ